MERKSPRAGLAPFASVEDLSDGEGGGEGAVEPEHLTLPSVKEEGGSGSRSPKMGVPTPRIDISRASSSSHQDDSSPERDLFTGGEGGTSVVKLGLGFTEEMAQELRNSTEELDFQDPTDIETKQRRRKLHQQQAISKSELEMHGDKDGKERKDSACSDTGFLYIGGRTSRLSSIGSAASGGSVASNASHLSGVSGVSHFSGVSHLSGASHLSATSQLSRASRCSSPHKMLLETSFCGPKPIPTVSLEAEYPPKDSVEKELLARKTDPTGVVLPVEGQTNVMVNGKTSGQNKDKKRETKEKQKTTKSSGSTLTVGREPSLKHKSSEHRAGKSQSSKEVKSSSSLSKASYTTSEESSSEVTVITKIEVEKSTPRHRKEPPRIPPGSDAKFISLHDDNEEAICVPVSKNKSLPLDGDSRIISLHADIETPIVPVNDTKTSSSLEPDQRIISLHSDEPPQLPPKSAPPAKRKTPVNDSSSLKPLPAKRTESKSAPASTSKRKEPIKYEGDQIFIPLTGDETPIVLSGGKKTHSSTVLEGDSRIIPLHSPEDPIESTDKSVQLSEDCKKISLKGDEIEIHTNSRRNDQQIKMAPIKRKSPIPLDTSAVIIPLHGDEEIVALEIETDHPTSPEYGIYIPLKGPELADYSKIAHEELKTKEKKETLSKPTKLDVKPKGKTSKTSPSVESKQVRKKHEKQEEELVKFVSLHADESERQPLKIEVTEEFDTERYDLKASEFRSKSSSPVFHAEIHSIQTTYFKPDDSTVYSRKHSTSSCRSPELEGAKVKPATLDLTSIVRPSRPVQSLTQLTRDESRTPSPAASMSRGSLFRRSSESSSSTKSRASVSSDFRTRKDSKNKSVFSSLFKKGSRDSVRRKSELSENTAAIDPRLTRVEFKFNQQDSGREGDSIIIPLHSPDSVVPPLEPEIDPPDLTAETVQTISEVVAAIEELKSQPLISPVPTPAPGPSLPQKEKPPTVTPAEKPEHKLEIATTRTEIQLEIEDTQNKETLKSNPQQNEEILEFKPKSELELQPTIDADVSPGLETSVGSEKTQLAAPTLERQESDKKSDSETMKTGSEERRSSESEPDSDAVSVPPDSTVEDDNERKGLFHQAESLEDELPYVPTTLPLERTVGHHMIPVKQRALDSKKTCPIERPRPTTPINPTTLDDYVYSPHEESTSSLKEKMQIVLPRTESLRESRSKSPHKPAVKPWTDFAEQGLQSPRELRRTTSPSRPPPLPPRALPAPAPAAWVCFDEVPERRRTPKRITTLPTQPVYSYVNPEECSCECHESQSRAQCSSGSQTRNIAQCSDSGTSSQCQYRTQ